MQWRIPAHGSGSRQPHEVPLEELAHFVGPSLGPTSAAASDAPGEGDPARRHEDPWLVPMPSRHSCCPTGGPGRWLGVTVYTPHYRSSHLAVRCLDSHGVDHVTDVILDDAAGGPRDVAMTCVPTRPQRSSSSCTFIRFPTVVHHHPCGRMVGIMMDLSTVGGHFYACLLPQMIGYAELIEFATQQTSFSDDPLVVFVGDSASPCSGESLQLHDGDILEFTRDPSPRGRLTSVHDLFREALPGVPLISPFGPMIGVVRLFTMERSVSLCLPTTMLVNRR